MLRGMRHLLGACAVLSLLVIGCGDGGSSGDPVDASTGSPDAAVPPGYTRLVGRTWSMPAGQADTYKCVRLTVPTDTFVTNISAQAPAGTHHTVLSIAAGNAAGPDGEYDCGVGTIGRPMIYASGVGTDDLAFPTNVGLKIAAGTQVHLNLHLFNATDQVLNGDSGILVKTVPTQPPMLAEMIFAGSFNIAIPSNNQPTTVTGGCTVSQAYQMFAYWPHMHQAATHSKLELTRNSVKTVLHDAAYSFNEQEYYKPSAEISVAAGDRITVTCTYVNNTGQTLRFGDSSNQEMCFTGLYRYPSQNASLTQCTEIPNGFPP